MLGVLAPKKHFLPKEKKSLRSFETFFFKSLFSQQPNDKAGNPY
jgi:hypothetical protein